MIIPEIERLLKIRPEDSARLVGPPILAPAGYVPVWTYPLLVTVAISGMAIAFMSSDGAFCSVRALAATGAGESASCLEFWLNRYQGVIAGSFALIAAYVGFQAVRRQILVAERIEARRRDRAVAGAMSLLPSSLADICNFALAWIATLTKRAGSDHCDQSPGDAAEPHFPIEAVAPMRECVLALDADEAAPLVELLSFLQVFRSRLRGLNDGTAHCDDLVHDALALYARASDVFAFARGADEDRSRPSASDLIDLVHVLRIDTGRHARLVERLMRNAASASSPHSCGPSGSP